MLSRIFRSSMSFPSSLNRYTPVHPKYVPPKTNTFPSKEAAFRLEMGVTLSFTGRVFHSKSEPIWSLSTELMSYRGLYLPQKEKHLIYLRRMLPGNAQPVVRGGSASHLLALIEYFSQVFKGLTLYPPRAIRLEWRPLSEIELRFNIIEAKSTLLP